MAHDRASQHGGNINLPLQALDLGGVSLRCVLIQAGADSVGVDGHAAGICLRAQIGGVGKLFFIGRPGHIQKFDSLKAHLLRLADSVKMRHPAGSDVLLERVGTDGNFHGIVLLFCN